MAFGHRSIVGHAPGLFPVAGISVQPNAYPLPTDRRRNESIRIHRGLALSPLALLAACGGGSSGGAGTPPPPSPSVTGQGDVLTIPAGSTSASGNVLTNDTTANTTATLSVTAIAVQNGATGTVGQPLAGALGSLTIQANGAYSYTADATDADYIALAAGQTRTEVFTYTPAAGATTGAAQTLTITVTGVNDAPITVADSGSIAEDAAVATITGNVRLNDSDPDGTPREQLTVTGIAHELTGDGIVGLEFYGQYGSIRLNADGSYTYELDTLDPDVDALGAGETAVDVFTYTIRDPEGATRAGTITITITGADEFSAPPSVAPMTATITLSGSRVIGANEILYMTNGGPMFGGYTDTGTKLVNQGLLWVESSDDASLMAANNFGNFTNLGRIVVDAIGDASLFYAGSWGMFTNEGEAHVRAEAGDAYGYRTYDPSGFGTNSAHRNSGLLSIESIYGGAYGVTLYNGGTFLNTASGAIIVEGSAAARGLLMYGHGGRVVNDGIIEARATGSNQTSYGLVGHFNTGFGGSGATITNNGTIRADVAIKSEYYFSPMWNPVADIVVNTGVIDGDIDLWVGDDSIDNDGTIEGNVVLGEGNDQFLTANGLFNGTADLGWGDDAFTGGQADESVAAGRGNDMLAGGVGHDLLLGGLGNDVINGGSGNDGLYGEFGNDRITVQNSDLVDAGAGDDTILLLDTSFLSIRGGDGHDILDVSAAVGSMLLSAFTANDRISGIEEIVLGNGDSISISRDDVIKLSGGMLTIDGASGASSVTLYSGNWTADGTSMISGTTFSRYVADGATILVKHDGTSPSATVKIAPAADADAQGPSSPTGPTPPSPGGTAGLELSSATTTVTTTTYLRQSFTVDVIETWRHATGGTVFGSDSAMTGGVLTNFGTITSKGSGAVVTVGLGYATTINHGVLVAESTGGSAIAVAGDAIENSGHIDVRGISGTSAAYSGWMDAAMVNSGIITVSGGSGTAVGFTTYYGDQFTNSGTLHVSGQTAIGAQLATTSTVVNDGTIEAVDGGGANSYAIQLTRNNWGGMSFVYNNGVLKADIAVSTSVDANISTTVFNTNSITGAIELFAGNDQVHNSGTIIGDLRLGTGDDVVRLTTSTGAIFGSANGDDGTDRLQLVDDAGATLSLGSLISAGLDNFERVELTGTGNTIFNFTLTDVLSSTDMDHQLFVEGASGDSITLDGGWTAQANQTVNGTTYSVYTNSGATLFVETEVNVIA